MMKWRLKVAFKQLRWRLISRLIWWQSEAMRRDYTVTRDLAWSENYAFPSFSLWLSERVFGDASGYRSSAAVARKKQRILDCIQKIERENFENEAGCLNNFEPWHLIKDLLEQ